MAASREGSRRWKMDAPMLPVLPDSLAALVAGYAWRPIAIGASSARTFRLERPGGPTLFLKTDGSDPGKRLLSEEKAVLDWLQGRLPVPQLLAFLEAEGHAYLLTSGLPGRDAASLEGAIAPGRLASLLGQGLRAIHSLPSQGCPLDRSLDVEIAIARRNVAQGWIDEGDFDLQRQGRKATDLLDELLSTHPSREGVAFTHGDYCLPNVIISRGAISGFVDWSRGGVGDPYRDIALAIRSIGRNLGRGFEQDFFDAYGLASPDWDRISYFMLLDEFF
ncbi:MAG: aminoglycoside 3'-phosphotransferase [Chloroflexi bacterium]|nr:aminoglycoside 3'-phosphotransferase [Chloroflexota bacterium]